MDEMDTKDDLTWASLEFVEHEKSAGWYGALALAGLGLSGLILLLTRDVISSVVVAICIACLGAYATRKPRNLTYSLNDQGISIGSRYHSLDDYKSFAVVPEGSASSVIFTPIKRFAPLLTVYYQQKDEDRIIDLLTAQLPMAQYKPDAIDQLMHKIRF